MWGHVIQLLVGLAVGAAIVALILNWEKIANWFIQNRDANSKIGALVKEKLDSGNYTVVAGIFNAEGELTSANRWDEATLEEEVLQEFGESDQLLLDLTA